MSAGTGIQWTDATWVNVTGCTRVSTGCDKCYSARLTHRLAGMGQTEKYGGLTVLNPKGDRHFNGIIKLHDDAITIPLKWKKPRRIFVNSMSDTFHKDVPFEFIDKVFAVMALCPQHTFQVLTKRPERMAEYFAAGEDAIIARWAEATDTEIVGPCACLIVEDCKWPLPNVWLGTSVEDQAAADTRIPHLLRCPAAVRFLSCEPLLGELDVSEWLEPGSGCEGQARQDCEICGSNFAHVNWVITGGESGHNCRPCNVRWIRDLVDQCRAAGVPVFVKQLGAKPFFEKHTEVNESSPNQVLHFQQHEKRHYSLENAKGGDWGEWTGELADLRVRQFPATPAAVR